MSSVESSQDQIEFSSQECGELNAELAGRAPLSDEALEKLEGRRRVSMLRLDDMQLKHGQLFEDGRTEPSVPPQPIDPVDEVVDHAFSNGGKVEATVPIGPAPVRANSSAPAAIQMETSGPLIEIDTTELVEVAEKAKRKRKKTTPPKAPEPDADRPVVAKEESDLQRAMMQANPQPAPAPQTMPAEDTQPVVSPEASASVETVPNFLITPPPVMAGFESHPAMRVIDPEPVPQASTDRQESAPTPVAAELTPTALEIDTDDAISLDSMGSVKSISPEPPPVPLVAPPPVPLVASPGPAAAPRRRRRAKQWFEEIFDEDYGRTLPTLTPRQTEREADFIQQSFQGKATGQPNGAILDVGCGNGRHALALAQRGFHVTGLDLSLPMLIKAADAARKASIPINFLHEDMREMAFENEYDGAYCMFTTFGYFDDDANRTTVANLARALKPGGKLVLDIVNRDYLMKDLPTRVWWEGENCVVLEEVDFNYFSSRLQVQRSIIFDDGRQMEQEISIRAYSLHEIGKLFHQTGLKVNEVSGGIATRGRFFGAHSRQIFVVAEKKSSG